MAPNSMSLPNATVCLPLFIGELDGTPRSRNETFGNITSAEEHHENLIDYFNQESLSKKIFLHTNWSNSLLHLVHTYLALLSFCETYDGNRIIVCSDDELQTHSNPEIPPWGIDSLASSRKLLETNLRALKVSVSELRQSFGLQVADYFSFRALSMLDSDYNNTSTKLIFMRLDSDYNNNITSLIFMPLFVGKQQICYELGIDSFLFTFKSTIIIYADKETLPWVVTETRIADMKTT
jgi:hypothetical protein